MSPTWCPGQSRLPQCRRAAYKATLPGRLAACTALLLVSLGYFLQASHMDIAFIAIPVSRLVFNPVVMRTARPSSGTAINLRNKQAMIS